MLKFLKFLFFDESGATLSMTRKVSNTLITAAGFNTNFDEVEAVINALEADNLSADSVTAAKLNVDCVRSGFGLSQHTDGSLQVDLATSSGLELDSGLKIADDGVTAAMLEDDLVFATFPLTPSADPDADYEVANKQYVDGFGHYVAASYTQSGAYSSTANTVPADDTIPTSSEGGQALAQTHTPANANNIIFVRGKINIAPGGSSTRAIAFLLVDGTTVAVRACRGTSSEPESLSLEYVFVAGGTSEITVAMRYGAASGTTFLNGDSASRLFGGKYLSSIIITEFEPPA